jgi:hypothetical protein
MRGYPSRLPPRGLLGLIAAVTVVPLAVLLWLGWQVLEQDTRLEQQRRTEQVTAVSDRVVAALDRAVATTEQRLAAGATDWPADAVTVRIAGNRLVVEPRRHVAFLPTVPPLETPDGSDLEA